MNTPFDWIEDALHSLKGRSLFRVRRKVRPLPGGRCILDGRELLNLSGNDYLGLADDPQVLEAVRESLNSGIGARASAVVTGRTELHSQLEDNLAQLKGTESALLFPTGFAANFGVINSLVGSQDVVFQDRLNHASLIDGARFSKARFRVYPHRNLEALERELEKSEDFRRRLIVTDSLFSMDGDAAPLTGLAALAEKYHAMLLVDEAHATGVFGDSGAGLLEEMGVDSSHVVAVGTLSKAIGSQGGYVTGSQELCRWVWNSARTAMFSTALSLPACVAANEAVQIIQQQPERRKKLLAMSLDLKLGLINQGWKVPEGVIGPIIPVIVGDSEKTLQLGEELQDAGILAATIRPPTVSNGTARLRLSLSLVHGDEGVETVLNAFSKLKTH